MILIPDTNWDKKDTNGNTILEWGIWSNSSNVIDVFHHNPALMAKFVSTEKAQIHNFSVLLWSRIFLMISVRHKLKNLHN
ncbi:hypothetical protein MCC_04835 [Rickettsia rhipicephali str. 3-7-female6-CWPP]|uniref:Uncharacterized protein n=1 Tax=Rickettsia rhipicephali (strain 3-7-female6-CWPP) TaxID=1105113 RepID=A0AAI8F7I2_RICR3|nr:hypothetical protein MCC_04835 [Rickettsia rhipicephali str. 3-7-female6-CWPP]